MSKISTKSITNYIIKKYDNPTVLDIIQCYFNAYLELGDVEFFIEANELIKKCIEKEPNIII